MYKFRSMLLVLAAILLFTACYSNNDKQVAPTEPTPTVPLQTNAPLVSQEPMPSELRIGYYLLESITQEGRTITGQEIDDLKTYLRINGDGTGVMVSSGVTTNLEWNATQLIVDGVVLQVALEDGTLVISPDNNMQMTFVFNGDVLPEAYASAQLEVGYYIVSSVGVNGDVTFYSGTDPNDGYLRLENNGTGVMFFEEEEKPLTWDESFFYIEDESVPYVYSSAEEIGDTEGLLMIYFMNDATSVALRPSEEPNS